jgi:hypothetical protein
MAEEDRTSGLNHDEDGSAHYDDDQVYDSNPDRRPEPPVEPDTPAATTETPKK